MSILKNIVLPNCFKQIAFTLVIVFSMAIIGNAQEDATTDTLNLGPKVYLDCGFCDKNYIRQNISYVNYVRDRKVADVQVVFVRQNTGSGGDEYQLNFTGLSRFEGQNDTLKCTTDPNATYDERRDARLSTLTLGLMKYVAHTPARKYITFDYEEPEEVDTSENKWHNWVYSASLYGALSGQEQSRNFDLEGFVNANKTTEEWKIELFGYYSSSENKYKYEDEVIIGINKEAVFNAAVVKSLTDRWSVGAWSGVYRSTYENYSFNLDFYPVVEFNIYPYSESAKRRFTIAWRLGYDYLEYFETTIFDKDREILLHGKLSSSYNLRTNWGSIRLRPSYQVYLHDFSKYEVEFQGDLSFNITKGLSLETGFNASILRNQLLLPKENASAEEILLQQQQLATNYQFYFEMGISYTFGSIYNSVVNPRFD